MQTSRFQDRVAVVTGAASGIGAATARALATEGAKLALLDANEVALHTIAAELHGSEAIVTDVASAMSIHAAFDTVMKRFGAVHVLVNSAGVLGFHRARGLRTGGLQDPRQRRVPGAYADRHDGQAQRRAARRGRRA